MASRTRPFAAFEWMIAWRYLRARRAEGGVSVMTWISLVGITLAVFALIATLSVRAGFRAEFVDTILGSNAHVTVYSAGRVSETGQLIRGFEDYDPVAERVRAVPGVTRAAPVVKGQVMATANGRSTGVEVFGMRREDVESIPRIGSAADAYGDLARLDEGIAIGSGVAQELGVTVGDRVRLISPDGVKTAFGTSPRVSAYEVVYVFTAGRYDIDRTRIYMPLAEAQSYFNREGRADEIEVMVQDPETVDELAPALMQAGGEGAMLWTWRESAGAFLRALTIEDNVMFVILSILVLIASMNIVSGLIMLVKNKGRDIGILRTMGLTEGSILRVFFLCGASTGLIGTALGVALGCLFTIYIDPIFSLVNYVSGGGVWDPSIRGIYALPAKLQLQDVLSAVALSLGLSFVVTLIPARRAARMNPVEALRYE
ncbi:lipoprotein-releasing ABC transporter permease subunit [Cereibacter sphaeroides]|uniref:lipoprotein-releasing ABC transporter permease subunit n=1 Tax=Cereibacter sphaeroides TaxID=1063 RepID=UPI001F3E3AE9|nr:lipoprotein-releasing ABC transporter permease subunit [Cereibacter sphaeroides]MCE6960219.1 lipoprotein-releasing ABC transporter permease subunit [Cereibacter sphaeroides]MCE6969221.1 lipoprotein-releasing ABC transporter permease subunit [Cereibacter sphaeroides]MCE6974830.1 lipoprotein-releasing ABC transporter permease subunit [Cereibacter sphaeroides]